MKCKALIYASIIALCAMATQGCRKHDPVDHSKVRRVFIMYVDAYNNLNSNIREDIKDLGNCLPEHDSGDYYKVLVFGRFTARNYDYSTPTSPVLMDLSRDKDGAMKIDTLMTYPNTMKASSAETMRTVLTYIRDNYPAKEYGMLISSHGTGWLPEGYYTNPSRFDPDYRSDENPFFSAARRPDAADGNVFNGARHLRTYMPEPLTKTIGGTFNGSSSNTTEIEITDLAAAIPMHLDYLLLDACLMGGIEVAYELRKVTDHVAFSQMEIMADGFMYKTLLSRLFNKDGADLVGACDDYYQYYVNEAPWPYATISLVRCDRLDDLATLCRDLFGKYREQIDAVDARNVQRYFRQGRHFFYDMEDILVKAGISESDHALLKTAIGNCLLYEAATKQGVLGDFVIKTHCGFSMYLPNMGTPYLNDFYKASAWNKATSLVK